MLGRGRFHQQPEVNHLPCFENDDLPCRLHVFHVVCRVNHHSRNRVNSSLQVAGGWLAASRTTASFGPSLPRESHEKLPPLGPPKDPRHGPTVES